MTPEQKIKREILIQARASGDEDLQFDGDVTVENVESLYDSVLIANDAHWDFESEMRSGAVETGLPSRSNRHYEAKEVAAKLSDGSWVGWTYWYGGGKHGEPEGIDWMGEAYELTVTEEEKLVVVRTFAKQTPEAHNA